MFERLLLRSNLRADERARARAEALAERLADAVPAGIAVRAAEGGVVLSGRGLRRRFALEAALRWLAVRQAQDGRGG